MTDHSQNTKIPSPPPKRRLRITPAFITEAAFSVGEAAYPAVVTGGYLDRQTGTFEVNFDALGYSGPAPISLTIDDNDIRAVKKMLGIGKDADRISVEEHVSGIALSDLADLANMLSQMARGGKVDALEIMGELSRWHLDRLRWMATATRQLADKIEAVIEQGKKRDGDGTSNDS